MTQQEKIAFLLAHGWKEREGQTPWRWYQRGKLGTYYALDHAVALARQNEKVRALREHKARTL